MNWKLHPLLPKETYVKLPESSLDITICFSYNRFEICNDSLPRFSTMAKLVVVMTIVHAVVFGLVLQSCSTEGMILQLKNTIYHEFRRFLT